MTLFDLLLMFKRDMSCFACCMECATSFSVSNIGACRTVIATSVRTPGLILLRGGIV